MLRPILWMHGTPELLHDWSWPVDSAGLRAMALDLSAVNLHANWDEPAWLPRVHPVQALLIIASLIVSSAVALKIFLLGTLLVAGYGCQRLARSLGAAALPATVGACWYVGAPFVADRLVAGHYWMLLAYAAYPFALESVVARRKWPVQFFWVACTSIDVHFIGFDVLGFCLLAISRTSDLRRQGGAWLGLLAFAPSLIAAPLAATSGTFAGQFANVFYNFVNSTPFDQAMRGVGYFAGYDASGRTPVQDVALWLAPVCAVIVGIRDRKYFAPLLLAVGAVCAAGTRGPAAFGFIWAFRTWSAASLYREFFDFVALVGLAGALSIALAPRRQAATIAVAVVAATAVLPQLTAAYGGLLRAYVPTRNAQTVIADLTRSPGTSLVVATPLQPPLAFADFPGGVDFLGNRLGTHGMIEASHQLEPIARAAIARPQPSRDDVLASFGIGFEIRRSGWISLASDQLEPGFQIAKRGTRGGASEAWRLHRLAAAPFAQFREALICWRDDYAALDSWRAIVYAGDAPDCPQLHFDLPVAATPYPRKGWVEYAPLWFVAPWAAHALPGSIFTTRPDFSMPLPADCDPHATYDYLGYEELERTVRRFERVVRNCMAPRTIGATVLEPLAQIARVTAIPAPRSARVDVRFYSPSFSLLEGTLSGDGFLEVSSRYSKLWKLAPISGVLVRDHLRTHADFNGWRLSGVGPFRAVAFYLPALIIAPIEFALFALYTFAILVTLVGAKERGAKILRLLPSGYRELPRP